MRECEASYCQLYYYVITQDLRKALRSAICIGPFSYAHVNHLKIVGPFKITYSGSNAHYSTEDSGLVVEAVYKGCSTFTLNETEFPDGSNCVEVEDAVVNGNQDSENNVNNSETSSSLKYVFDHRECHNTRVLFVGSHFLKFDPNEIIVKKSLQKTVV